MIRKNVLHYKIIEKIGEGGMGEVYLAEDTKLERKVAIKFLPEHLTKDKENVERFEREAKAAASLNHPNIVTIHEINEFDGQVFIVMEYIDGQSLRYPISDVRHPIDDVGATGPVALTIEDTINYINQICQGLSKAHEAGIVHRDIKPENILIDKDGRVKILDFGLAKLRGVSTLTKETSTLGTIHYMSPEQVQGQEIDHRSDIWSLGVIFYEMLTGQVPFKGEYESAVIYSIINDSYETLTTSQSGVPLELERMINKCLNKNPADRYQQIDELIVELEGLKSKITTMVSEKESLKKRSKQVLFPLATLSILILLVAGYFLIKPDEKSGSNWQDSIAVLPFSDLSPDKDQEYFCDGMTEKILTSLSKLKVLKVIARTSVMKYKNTEKTIPEIGEELGVENIVEGSVFKAGNRIRVTAQLINTSSGAHLWADDYERTLEDIFDIQDDISEKIASNLLATLSPKDKQEIKTNRPSNTDAYEYYMKGKYFHDKKYWKTENVEDFRISEKMFKKAIKLDPNYADSYAGLADLYNTYYNSLADTNAKKEKYMQLQESYIDTAIRLNPYSSEVYMAKGWVHYAKDEIEDAIRSELKAIEINNNNHFAYHGLGSMMGDRGLKKIKIKCYSKAIEVNPLEAAYYVQRAYEYTRIGEFDRAELDLKKALEMEPDFWWALIEYSVLLIDTKRYDQAKQMIERSMEFSQQEEVNRTFEAALYAINGEKEKALSVNLSNEYLKYNIYRLLKMSDETIQYLQEDFDRVKKAKNSWYLGLKNRPIYDFIRDNPQFQEILAKHKKLYDENLKKYGYVEGQL